jgi:hypothetical protein
MEFGHDNMREPNMVKVLNFDVVDFDDYVVNDKGKRVRHRIILLYALGEDGTIYEMSSGKWLALPIEPANLRSLHRTNND